jgi:hypothetical protein
MEPLGGDGPNRFVEAFHFAIALQHQKSRLPIFKSGVAACLDVASGRRYCVVRRGALRSGSGRQGRSWSPTRLTVHLGLKPDLMSVDPVVAPAAVVTHRCPRSVDVETVAVQFTLGAHDRGAVSHV